MRIDIKESTTGNNNGFFYSQMCVGVIATPTYIIKHILIHGNDNDNDNNKGSIIVTIVQRKPI